MRARRLSPEAQAHYTHVEARDLERARVVVVPRLTPGVVAMTLDRWVLVRRDHEDDVALLGHELVHVQQWREQGPVRFLVKYFASTSGCARVGCATGPPTRRSPSKPKRGRAAAGSAPGEWFLVR
jgi:hypothetical protein